MSQSGHTGVLEKSAKTDLSWFCLTLFIYFLPVYLCVVWAHVYMCSCMCVWLYTVQMCTETRGWYSLYLLRLGFLGNPEFANLSSIAIYLVLGNLLAPKCWDWVGPPLLSSIYVSAANLGPHTWAASTVSAASSPQTPYCWIFEKEKTVWSQKDPAGVSEW